MSNFSDSAAIAFAFLDDAGFRLVQRTPERVEYRRSEVFLAVERDPRSGESDVSFGLEPDFGNRDAFSLVDLLGMQEVRTHERCAPFQVADEARVGPFLARLADDVRQFGQGALVGDREFYRRLGAYREARSEEVLQGFERRQVRAEADRAWQAQDFDAVIRLLGSIGDELTGSQRAKLKYALQRKRP